MDEWTRGAVMFNIAFNEGSPWRKQLLFTVVHGALVGFGLGIGVALSVFVAVHFGWVK
jgi:hypothetical protein